MDEKYNDDTIMEFRERLKILRELKGLKQRELATYVGVSRTTISGYETKGYQPSHEKLQRMAQKLDVSIDYLVTGGPDDDTLRTKHLQSNKELAVEIALSCNALSYENKLKMLEFVHYLEYLDNKDSEDNKREA